MDKRTMQKFKKILLEKREDLMHIVRDKMELDLSEQEIGDEIDSALQNTEREILFELADNEKIILDGIETALTRIEQGKYGKCECCGQKIPEGRIDAIPWVRYCIKCKEESEKPK